MTRKKTKSVNVSDSGDITDASVVPKEIEIQMNDVVIDDQSDKGILDDSTLDKEGSDLESVDVNDREEFKDEYNDPNVSLPTPPTEKEGVAGFNLIKASGFTDTSSPTVSKSDLPDHATPSPIVTAKSLPLPPKEIFGSPEMPQSPMVAHNDPTVPESKSKVFTKRMDVSLEILNCSI